MSCPWGMNTQFGVYEGPGAGGVALIPKFSAWFGKPPSRAMDFFANDTWESLESDAAWTCACWGPAAGPVVPEMIFSLPLTVSGTPLADVAAGFHDNSFSSVAKSLLQYGWAKATIRIGWEFNGSWMPWAAVANPVGYVAAYRRVVGILREAAGSNFTFDWCTSWGQNATAPDSVYPGDDVVDVIGMDVYNRYYTQALSAPAARWANLLAAPYGLNWLVSFAALHKKRISFPEWGTGEWTAGDGGTGGGDDPLFVTNMAAFMQANNVSYCCYWDINAGSYNARVSDGEHPLSGTALKTAFSSPLTPPGPILWIGAGQPSTETSVSVNFSPPYQGGAADHFDILIRPVAPWTVAASVKQVGTQPVPGLKPGTDYEVCVRAVNAAGPGTPSAPIALTTAP